MAYAASSSGLGDLTCWGVDVAAWRAAHRVPVFPGQVNRWVVQVSGPTSAGDAEAKAMDLVRREVSGQGGVASDTKAQAVSDVAALGTVLAQSATDAAGLSWDDGTKTFVLVEFVLRGDKADMAWPLDGGAGSRECPKAVSSAVAYVFAARPSDAGSGGQVTPSGGGAGPAAPGGTGPVPAAHSKGLGSVLPWWAWIGAGLFVAVGVRRKSRGAK